MNSLTLNTEIGTAKDNQKMSIHNWYRFTAGFSYKLIDELIHFNQLDNNHKIFEPFAGCGTTLVQAQKQQITSYGNEGQTFMYDVIRAKLNWKLRKGVIKEHLAAMQEMIKSGGVYNEQRIHPLLLTLYTKDNLNIIYPLKDYLQSIRRKHTLFLFFKLALSQTLHKCSIHPISVPYISRTKTLKHEGSAWNIFEATVYKMYEDLVEVKALKKTSKIYHQDSRKMNKLIENESCNVCITSPPYLNNLDYGEVSKVHSHFFDITQNWNDITTKVRKKLVTASTTHYNESGFDEAIWKEKEFYLNDEKIGDELLTYAKQILQVRQGGEKKRNKSFEIMLLYYFEDMYFVLKEIKRVLEQKGKAFLILGDSAPYGVFVPTTDLLGKIGQSIGFDSYDKVKIRERGTKWKSLTHRHSLTLDENILILQ